ncbi:MAG: hypothetical protein ACXIUW_17425 [Roseinatronobacter sp.]
MVPKPLMHALHFVPSTHAGGDLVFTVKGIAISVNMCIRRL